MQGSEAARHGEQRCETCGRFDAVLIAETYLCESCLQERGSCCGGEESDDLKE